MTTNGCLTRPVWRRGCWSISSAGRRSPSPTEMPPKQRFAMAKPTARALPSLRPRKLTASERGDTRFPQRTGPWKPRSVAGEHDGKTGHGAGKIRSETGASGSCGGLGAGLRQGQRSHITLIVGSRNRRSASPADRKRWRSGRRSAGSRGGPWLGCRCEPRPKTVVPVQPV